MATTINMDAYLGPPQVVRWNRADVLKEFTDFDLPEFEVWNYGPCENHNTPRPDCIYQKCGGQPYAHQKKTALFSFFAERSMVANSTGTGKTLSALLTLALVNHVGRDVKALIIVPSTAVMQWEAETKRWTPGFTVRSIPPKTNKKDRLSIYASNWNILIVGYHSLIKDRGNIRNIDIRQLIIDDVDPSLNTKNATYDALKTLSASSDLVIVQNATSLQTHLLQLYAATSLIGGEAVWGTKTNFSQNFIKKEFVIITAKHGEKRRVLQTVGYKNMDIFKQKFNPMSIRITYDDISGDLAIPELTTEQVYLELTAKQRQRYEELQQGIRTILNRKDLTTQQKTVTALTAFTYGSQICSGLFSLKTSDGAYEPDSEDASAKLDWIMDKLDDEWMDEKVVVYAKYRGAISALQDRMNAKGLKYSTIWGVEPDPEVRKQEMERFWADPDTKVMIISVSGERSLNLQNASILVMWDLQLNPARVSQLAGRVRRLGSKNKRVFVFELLSNDTQEERYMASLSARQTLFDFVYDVDDDNLDPDELLIEKLDPDQVLKLIQP